MLAVLAALLALPAATLAADHRGGTFVTLASANAGTADPQVNATPQYWQLYQVTQDGLTAFRKSSGPAANSVVADLAVKLPRTSDGGRTWTLTLRRGIRYSNGAPVRPADVRFTFERLFKVHGPTAQSFYGAIDGAGACLQNPQTCTLDRGISLNGWTVTFHLTRPDIDWLQKLALPPVALLPPSVGIEEIGTDVSRLVGTGPYAWASYSPVRQLVLERNPFFKAWAPAAQPDGYVDRIVQRFGLPAEAAVTKVERGQADWVADELPSDRLSELASRFATQVHVNQLPADWYFALNVNIKPFNQLKARQAVNLAIDRNALVKLYGGSQLASPTCQVLPPGFPGYSPYCPWTQGGKAPGRRPTSRAPTRWSPSPARRATGSTSWSRTTPCRRRSASTFWSCCSSSATTRDSRSCPTACRRPMCRTRATTSSSGSRNGTRTSRRPPTCWTACSAATPSSRIPTPAPTSAASATAPPCSR